jgi:hypothetical protein
MAINRELCLYTGVVDVQTNNTSVTRGLNRETWVRAVTENTKLPLINGALPGTSRKTQAKYGRRMERS